MKNFIEALLVFTLLLAATAVPAQDEVKYCKDATTGDIITVGAGMPCPYPTHEL